MRCSARRSVLWLCPSTRLPFFVCCRPRGLLHAVRCKSAELLRNKRAEISIELSRTHTVGSCARKKDRLTSRTPAGRPNRYDVFIIKHKCPDCALFMRCQRTRTHARTHARAFGAGTHTHTTCACCSRVYKTTYMHTHWVSTGVIDGRAGARTLWTHKICARLGARSWQRDLICTIDKLKSGARVAP